MVGVLGCPNLPQVALVDADGQAGASSRSSEESVGCLFAAQKGQGAFVGPLRGDSQPCKHQISLLELESLAFLLVYICSSASISHRALPLGFTTSRLTVSTL